MINVVKARDIIKSIVLIVVAISLILCVSLNSNAIAEIYANNRKVPVYRVESDSKKVAVTFDAAWGADKTQGIMDILSQYNAKGTFFLVGFWVQKYPDMVKEIAKNGYSIGNHSNNHLKMSTLGQEEILNEINTVNDMIKELTGETPRFFRAPFGDYDNLLIETIDSINMQCIQWDVDSLDWKGLSGAQITQRVTSKVKDGSIILFHNNSDHILTALPLVLLSLQNKGYQVVGLEDLVLENNYIIDNNGEQKILK